MTIQGISVVIPAYNEELFLPATLLAVKKAANHFFSSHKLPTEVIVVNNLSTDKTEIVAQNLGATVITHPVRNISAVRNAGIFSATYDLIVTIDADSFLPETGLSQIWKVMETKKHIGGALGVKVISDKLTVKLGAWIIQKLVVMISGIYGAMFFFSKEAAIAIGGFPENRLVAEDTAFAINMRTYAKKKNLNFIRLKSVQVGTLYRKSADFKIVGPMIFQVIKAALGFKQSTSDLKYWYEPDR